MKQKLTIIVHKFDRSLLIVPTQLDLAILLGVSLSTIKRKYNDIGVYDTDIYTVYVGAKTYDNGEEKNYRHDVVPPVVKTYNSTKRTNNSEDMVQKNYPDRNIVQPIEDELIEELLLPSQQHEYYLNLFKGQSQEYVFKKFCEWRYTDKPRALIIQSIADKMFDIVRE